MTGNLRNWSATLLPGATAFMGLAAPLSPTEPLTSYSREYPFAWLGILAAVAPSNDELVYAHSPGASPC